MGQEWRHNGMAVRLASLPAEPESAGFRVLGARRPVLVSWESVGNPSCRQAIHSSHYPGCFRDPGICLRTPMAIGGIPDTARRR